MNKLNEQRILVLNDQGGAVMNISYDVTATLRADMKHHEPIVLISREVIGVDLYNQTTTGGCQRP